MSDRQNNLMLPEDALTRFGNQDASILHLDLPVQNNTSKRYGFQLGDIGILISENTLSEVMKNFDVFTVPNTHPWFQGLSNLRGNLVPVFDMAMLLGVADQSESYGNLLIMDRGVNSIGILIESLPKVCETGNWKKLSYSPQMPAGLSEYITEVYMADDRIWIGFDHVGYFESIKDMIAL